MLRASAIILVLSIITAVLSFGVPISSVSVPTKGVLLLLLILLTGTLFLGVIQKHDHE